MRLDRFSKERESFVFETKVVFRNVQSFEAPPGVKRVGTKCFFYNFPTTRKLRRVEFSGDDSGGATPDPIPNSEVKSSSADGTAGVTLWESRTSPGLFFNTQLEKSSWVFFLGT